MECHGIFQAPVRVLLARRAIAEVKLKEFNAQRGSVKYPCPWACFLLEVCGGLGLFAWEVVTPHRQFGLVLACPLPLSGRF